MRMFAAWVFVLVCPLAVHGQGVVERLRAAWSQPVEPYRVIDNIYYVGASGISSHIVSTSEGLILVDTGTTTMVPLIQAGIEKLGFGIKDVKIIVSSHAHWDHVEGHAEMKRRTGAKIMALGEDAESIASGVDISALGGDGWEAVKVDRVLEDGDTVTLGDVTMTAHLTRGHTKGCTTWATTVDGSGKELTVVFIGGTSINGGVNFIDNKRHPGILEDYARTFERLKDIQADVFLAQHPSMYDMAGKMEKMKAGGSVNPFINPEEYREFVRNEEGKYLKQAALEKSGE